VKSGAGPPTESDARGDLALLLAAIATRLRHVVTDSPASAPDLRNTVLDCVRALQQLVDAHASKATAAPVCVSAQTAADTSANVRAAGATSVHRNGKQDQRPPSDGP
jgi:hypothetical protein